jgi:hypothetical protein
MFGTVAELLAATTALEELPTTVVSELVVVTASELEEATSPAVPIEELDTAGLFGATGDEDSSSPQASNPNAALKVRPKAIFLKIIQYSSKSITNIDIEETENNPSGKEIAFCVGLITTKTRINDTGLYAFI